MTDITNEDLNGILRGFPITQAEAETIAYEFLRAKERIAELEQQVDTLSTENDHYYKCYVKLTNCQQYTEDTDTDDQEVHGVYCPSSLLELFDEPPKD